LLAAMWAGAFPAVYDREIPPADWYQSYIATYVERDVRQILKIGDLDAFRVFLQMCAGRTGQVVNLSQLGADCGVSHNTARAWLSVLDAGFIAFRVPPMHSNRMKRLVKTPKLHFYDTGLACALLGIRSSEQLRAHPLRGSLFESWVASEILKARLHRGLPPDLCFFRDRRGLEVDLLVELASELIAVEVKSGQTVASDFFANLSLFRARHHESGDHRTLRSCLVYGGDAAQHRHEAEVLPWREVANSTWW
jgi:predicted AAA+ superfamily ATPase